jgi:hypothetical protein
MLTILRLSLLTFSFIPFVYAEENVEIKGKVLNYCISDNGIGSRIGNATVAIVNESGVVLEEKTTDAEGEFIFIIPRSKNMRFRYYHGAYTPNPAGETVVLNASNRLYLFTQKDEIFWKTVGNKIAERASKLDLNAKTNFFLTEMQRMKRIGLAADSMVGVAHGIQEKEKDNQALQPDMGRPQSLWTKMKRK